MCLIGFALNAQAGTLMLASNRDEYFERATQPAHWWQDRTGVFAGRDLQAGGTWLGLHQRGRLAALTNFRDGGTSSTRSRGELVTKALNKDEPAEQLVQTLGATIEQYAGCSLLVFDWEPGGTQEHSAIRAWCVSNRDALAVQSIRSGVFALSNGLLNEPWPKSERLKRTFDQLGDQTHHHEQALLGTLTDHQIPDVGTLPNTGIGEQREAELAPAFIRTQSLGSSYGTLSSAIVRVNVATHVHFDEWTWHHGQNLSLRARRQMKLFARPGPQLTR